MRLRSLAVVLTLAVFLAAQSGCGTLYNLSRDSPPQTVRGRKVASVPQGAVYGGIRQDFYWLQMGGAGGGGYEAWIYIWELTACLALDTILLPVTIPKNTR